jgi:maltooligosyltrehalose trehalohydrolase
MTAFLLLAPATPLLFQGQEWGSSAPFVFFADHGGELGAAVRKGRLEFLSQFRTLADPDARAAVPDPAARETFVRCALDWDERASPRGREWLALHRDLLRLRREDAAIAEGGETGVEVAVLAPSAFVLRWLGTEPAHARLLVVNLGRELDYEPPSEPLLAPPFGLRWRTRWSSESAAYGGRGVQEAETDAGWIIPARSAVLLAPAPRATPAPRKGAGETEAKG